jgi:hypothetical protein
MVGCQSKTPTVGAPGRGSRRRSHGELDGFNLHQATVTFNRGDTFVFGSWVCTADGAGSFQRRLTMTPNPRTGLVTLPEVITGNLAGNFALQPTRRLRVWIRLQLELDVPVGHRMRVGY